MLRLTRQTVEHLTPDDLAQLLTTHTPIGSDAETGDLLFIPDKLRASGLYALGTQGVGKTYTLISMAVHDARQGRALIYVDPHGDAIYEIIRRLPEEALPRTYLLDMKDKSRAFGLNPFATMLDMLPLLTSQQVRSKMVANVQDETVREFWTQHDALTESAQIQRVTPITNRLNALFMGHPTICSIVGQKETTLDFRRSADNREIILIPAPLKTNKDEARLVITMILSMLSSAIFSYADTLAEKRHGVSVFIDEFEHFCTPDFAELFTEGRKYGVRLTLAHQYMGQLPSYLRLAVQTAATKFCFRVIPDDAREMAQYFIHGQTTIRPEDMTKYPVEELLHL